MNLSDWLGYIETLHVREIELGLERVREFAERLQLYPVSARVITVAGTNGKGSCVATLEALLLAQGFRVGAYTSPHLQRYNERIRTEGRDVSDAALCEAFARVEQCRQQTPLTYFEFGTLAALWLFQQADLDVVILEVGLGGRLDAVNIIDCDIAIITSIDLDHMAWLGTTREAIAFEKAGIMRSGRPLVCADRSPPAGMLELAANSAVPVYQIGQEFDQSSDAEGQWSWSGRGRDDSRQQVTGLPIPGLHADGVAAALQALELLEWRPDPAILGAVLGSLSLAGRFEQFYDPIRSCQVILDVAHNPAAARLLASRLQQWRVDGGAGDRAKILLVLAIMADKDVPGVVAALDSVVDIWYIAQVDQARCMPAQQLAEHTESIISSSDLSVYQDVPSAYQAACRAAGPEDVVVVTGSFFTVAEIRNLLGENTLANNFSVR
ncbi:MAG: bifunctional tetrahydrofolate synthase/dihydrofolate synthase [Gammaproteobacteria bacterium]|nr:bifunctional tetrahydrofolate synthase/dihydrofolate synthase [Pseudomonadales bacterium]